MAYVGTLDLFTIGIGPSSSHTVGPMRASRAFALEIPNPEVITRTQITLYGSLAATGAGHGTTNALVAGLAGQRPEECNPAEVLTLFEKAKSSGEISLLGHKVSFAESDLVFERKERLDKHSNGMRFHAFSGEQLIHTAVFFSVGGGFIESETETIEIRKDVPFPYQSAVELLIHANSQNTTIAEIAYRNEVAIHGEESVNARLTAIWSAMKACIESGLNVDGTLPGYLNVSRRAQGMAKRLEEMSLSENAAGDLTAEWLQAFAIAVNEENAAGMRVVTAPTNGAAGILGNGIDVVLHVGAGAYICGEETALLDSLEGFRGQPRLRPPFPAIAGLYARPTVVNNVESIASVPAIVMNGAEWYQSMGTEKSKGTTLYSLSGHVVNPGQFEAPLGITHGIKWLFILNLSYFKRHVLGLSDFGWLNIN